MCDNWEKYIIDNKVKKEFQKSHIFVTTNEEVFNLKSYILCKIPCNLIFKTTSLKNYFLSLVQMYGENISLINCNSSTDKILYNISRFEDFIILYNINKCSNFDILNKLTKNRILIC